VIEALTCDGAVPETQASSFTGDLVALAVLIKMSWPAGALFVPPGLREQVTLHVGRTQQVARQLRDPSPNAQAWLMRRPPGDPATCAALMLAADEILALDWRERREAAALMTGRLRIQGSRALHMIHRDHCSSDLRATLAFRRERLPLAGRIHQGPVAVSPDNEQVMA
jgi:hypothetical protein